MIFRNQIMNPTQMSANYILNKQRKQKYQAHLNKISEIQKRPYKSKQHAKIIQNHVKKLTSLKQFARNFKAKQEKLEKLKNDLIMIQRIEQIKQSRHFVCQEDTMRKTKSTVRFGNNIVASSLSTKLIRCALKEDKIKKQNQRLIKSISDHSFDETKFRRTLKQSTKDYLKIRSHMRRVKDQKQSLKKLRTEPTQQLFRATPISLVKTSKNNEQYELTSVNNGEFNQQKSQNLSFKFKKSKSKNKKLFTINDTPNEIIDKKLKIFN